ncbi:HNH endonuclease [Microbacterium forte]|uniref:HNH endonuclease n=1 Tax=Microbacterium forte TaxID=2982533 RepID=UPI002893399D|nr:HNH endonuclease signature motif containing protein [Microbacterium sp. A(2022)]
MPNEGLNRPDVFLGVLRALRQNEGRARSSPELHQSLTELQTSLGAQYGLDLARTGDRNLLRNAGQYWTTLGVLKRTPLIDLTDLGREYADGLISPRQFAVHTIVSLYLPSSSYNEPEHQAWSGAGIRFRPLLLILEIIHGLGAFGASTGYITDFELRRIVQPLSATRPEASYIADAIRQYREGQLDISSWPRTTTQSNDSRSSREFLRFLTEYDFLVHDGSLGEGQRYRLGDIDGADIGLLVSIGSNTSTTDETSTESVAYVATTLERRRATRSVLERPGQRQFRFEVFDRANKTCLITGSTVVTVLEAAHIRPYSISGLDDPSNGLCLRADIHSLFDSNKVRIDPTGEIHYATELRRDVHYAQLPSRVELPAYVSPAHVKWRWDYY